MSGRRARVEGAMQVEMADLLRREVRDPRVNAGGMVSVTRVEVNVDLSVARVYVSIIAQDAAKTMTGLAACAGFLRGPLARRLNMSKPAELRFIHDQSVEVGARLTEIVREDAARAAGPTVTEPTSTSESDPDHDDASS